MGQAGKARLAKKAGGGKRSSEFWVLSSEFLEIRTSNRGLSRPSRLFQTQNSEQSLVLRELPKRGLDGTKIPLRHRGKTNLIQ